MISVALDSFDCLDKYLKSPADMLIIGLEGWAARCRAVVPASHLAGLGCLFHAHGKRLGVNLQAMIEEIRIDEAAQALKQALEAGADTVYIADDGFIQLAFQLEEQGLNDARRRLVMQPETLICSGQDARFFEQLGLQAESLSHELALEEIIDCAAACSSLEVLIAGHTSWMESRRPLVENYLRHIGKEDAFQQNALYSLRELQRQSRLPVWQDALGTHILSDQPVQIGAGIFELAKAGISRFRIDALISGDAWALDQLERYAHALDTGQGEGLPPVRWRQRPLAIRKEKTDHAH